MKNELIVYILLGYDCKFSPKIISKKDKRRLKKHPNSINLNSFRISRFIKSKFKRRAKICISHKNGCVGVAFGKGKFGIDIEEIKERNFSSAADFCFTKDELETYNKSRNINTFYQIYTTKEALIKAKNLSFSELGLINSLKEPNYERKTFVINNTFMISVVFKGKKDIILKFL